ncbi:MAG TPA: OmpA family protein [Candidatus Kapabacteria bacterium]|nr:OmpA family protein [Candidatus Kapabacteria bacterium]
MALVARTAMCEGTMSVETTVRTTMEGVNLSIRNVDCTRFPEISMVLDVQSESDNVNISKNNIEVFENNYLQHVLSLDKVVIDNKIPVDIVFVLDKTGSMKDKVAEIRQSIDSFIAKMTKQGIDYRLGLVTFSDAVESVSYMTDSEQTLNGWLDKVVAEGGGDDKENALEGLRAATNMRFRPGVNRIALLITDAECHQRGEHGDGTTDLTSESAARLMSAMDIRTFCITDTSVKNYNAIAAMTGGEVFNLSDHFDRILNNVCSQMKSYYVLRYESSKPYIPDSMYIQLYHTGESRVVATKAIPVLEIGQKLDVDNILFQYNSAEIEPQSFSTLNRIVQMLKARPTLHIRVLGHSDSTGADEYNFRLSQQRAFAVQKYIAESGIDAHRIEPVGMGKGDPIAPNTSEDGRRLNRRTEFIITEK